MEVKVICWILWGSSTINFYTFIYLIDCFFCFFCVCYSTFLPFPSSQVTSFLPPALPSCTFASPTSVILPGSILTLYPDTSAEPLQPVARRVSYIINTTTTVTATTDTITNTNAAGAVTTPATTVAVGASIIAADTTNDYCGFCSEQENTVSSKCNKLLLVTRVHIFLKLH